MLYATNENIDEHSISNNSLGVVISVCFEDTEINIKFYTVSEITQHRKIIPNKMTMLLDLNVSVSCSFQ